VRRLVSSQPRTKYSTTWPAFATRSERSVRSGSVGEAIDEVNKMATIHRPRAAQPSTAGPA
jgi:hypothetical protein